MLLAISILSLIPVVCLGLFLAYLFYQLQSAKPASTELFFSHQAEDVRNFYNQTTDQFIQVYGTIIQAFRTKNVEQYLHYTAKQIGLANMSKVLDAGCGVAGPAIYFAQQFPKLSVDAITISDYQVEKAKAAVAEAGLSQQICLFRGDYHRLDDLLPENAYDAVYFLESFGHSPNKNLVLEQAYNRLKPGGKLYIKDLFRRICANEWEQNRVNEICLQINQAYQYQIADLNPVLDFLRAKGMIIHRMGVPEVDSLQFENLSISNDFQNLFNIGKIESWDDYVFPIDFYEILAEKPIQADPQKVHLYILNNQGGKTA